MNDGLIEQWRAQTARALGWKTGGDPMPVLEALSLSVALELTGDLLQVPGVERDGLRRVGQRALLFVGGPVDDEDELEVLRMGAELARDGLRALANRPLVDEAPSPIDARKTTSPSELVRLLAGQLDGFAAGSLAIRVRRSEAALDELRALARLRVPAPRTLRLAAADAGVVLDPAEGRAVGSLAALGAEAVLFEGTPRRLAVYAEEPHPLRLVAAELTTEDVREGYWIGRVAEGARSIDATLHAGERAERWRLDLSC